MPPPSRKRCSGSAQYGDKASSERVEQLFAALAAALKAKGFTRFIVAGNVEHCGADPGVEAFHIGPTISACPSGA